MELGQHPKRSQDYVDSGENELRNTRNTRNFFSEEVERGLLYPQITQMYADFCWLMGAWLEWVF